MNIKKFRKTALRGTGGRSVAPAVSFRCAEALAKVLDFACSSEEEDPQSPAPTEKEYRMVESFLKNLHIHIGWARKPSKKTQEQRKTKLEELVNEQKRDMAETGHGKVN